MAFNKEGIDYYSHFIGMTNDEKLSDLRMEYGSVAIDVWLTLLDLIYGGKGYYIDYGDEKTKNRVVWKILGIIRGKYPPTPETVMAIIEGLVACELFSGDLFKSGILSSKRIQEQFYQATVERKAVDINLDYWLLDFEKMKKLSSRNSILQLFENQPILSQNQPIVEVNQPIIKQSKVKESKVKKSKVKESKEDGVPPTPDAPQDNCMLIFELYNRICRSYPRITQYSEARKKAVKASLKKYNLKDFERLFKKAESSDFLKGKIKCDWRATFDWLINDTNMAKVLDGNYDNRSKNLSEQEHSYNLEDLKAFVNDFGGEYE
mgnify:FL=1